MITLEITYEWDRFLPPKGLAREDDKEFSLLLVRVK